MLTIYPLNEEGLQPVRCQLDTGVIWFIVVPLNGGTHAELRVYDEEYMIAMRDDPRFNDDNGRSYEIAMKNKHGFSRLRKAFRALQAAYPNVKSIEFKKESGANPGVERKRTNG